MNFENRLGKCFQLAADFVVNNYNDDFELIHGRIRSPFGDRSTFEIVDHAWCERRDQIYDPVLDWTVPRPIFDALFRPERLSRYTSVQALEKMLATEHYGPWDMHPQAAPINLPQSSAETAEGPEPKAGR